MIRRPSILVAVLVAGLLHLAPRTAAAQEAPSSSRASTADPIFSSLFTPELIMQHRRAIGLTDEQRDAISRVLRELQGQVVSLQWDLQDDVASLRAELDRPRVDLDRALDRMDRVLQVERRIKAAHLTLLVRIKNVLTADQQVMLRRLRDGG